MASRSLPSILSALAIVSLGSEPVLSGDRPESMSFQTARERVAAELAPGPGQRQPLRFSIREVTSAPPGALREGNGGGWLSWLGWGSAPTSQAPRIFEIVVRSKSGEELVIDKVQGAGNEMMSPLLDSTGAIVGYFRHDRSAGSLYRSAHGTLVMYLVASSGLIVSTGEWKCNKTSSAGEPRLDFSNARWVDAERAVHVNVRSSCGVVDFHGGSVTRRLLNLTGLEFAAALQKNANDWTDESSPYSISFSDEGEIVSIEPFSVRARDTKACIAIARATPGFKVCGPDDDSFRTVVWRADGEVKEHTIGCSHPVSTVMSDLTADYVLEACSGTQGEQRKFIVFQIAHRALRRLDEFLLECDCAELVPSRSHVDVARRTISFNLRTDAEQVRFEGGVLHMPKFVSRTEDAANVLTVPLITIRFNENGQIVEIVSTIPGRSGVVRHPEPK